MTFGLPVKIGQMAGSKGETARAYKYSSVKQGRYRPFYGLLRPKRTNVLHKMNTTENSEGGNDVT